MISIKENVNNVQEFNYIFDAVGWGHFEEPISQKALDNSLYSVSVYDDNKIIGFGRLVGDGICYVYFQDITVIPKYQGKNIGTMIMNKLLEHIDEIKKENPLVRVYIGASKGKEGFYTKFGFVDRVEAGLGSGMILKK